MHINEHFSAGVLRHGSVDMTNALRWAYGGDSLQTCEICGDVHIICHTIPIFLVEITHASPTSGYY